MRAAIAIKKLYLTARNRLARKVWAKEHASLQNFLAKCAAFGQNNSGTEL